MTQSLKKIVKQQVGPIIQPTNKIGSSQEVKTLCHLSQNLVEV